MKKDQVQKKKLVLSKQSIRELDREDLSQVGGGWVPPPDGGVPPVQPRYGFGG